MITMVYVICNGSADCHNCRLPLGNTLRESEREKEREREKKRVHLKHFFDDVASPS